MAAHKEGERLDRLYQLIESKTEDLDTIEVLITNPDTLDISKPAPSYGKSPWMLLVEREKGREESILDAVIYIYTSGKIQVKLSKIWERYQHTLEENNARGRANGAEAPAAAAVAPAAAVVTRNRNNNGWPALGWAAAREFVPRGVGNGAAAAPAPPPPPPPPPPSDEDLFIRALNARRSKQVIEILPRLSDEFLKTLNPDFFETYSIHAYKISEAISLFTRLIPLIPDVVSQALKQYNLYQSFSSVVAIGGNILKLALTHLSISILDGSDTVINKEEYPQSIINLSVIGNKHFTADTLPILLARGYDPSAPQPSSTSNECLITVAIFYNNLLAFEMCLRAVPDKVNELYGTGYPLLVLTGYKRGHQEFVQKLLEFGANPSLEFIYDSSQNTPYTILETLGFSQVEEHERSQEDLDSTLQLLLDSPQFDLDKNLAFAKQLYQLRTASRRYKYMYNKLSQLKRTKMRYEGYAQEDILEFNGLLRKPMDYSICPICLATVERPEGCMYMRHHCPTVVDIYDEELYSKYKDWQGQITWCTFCSRICSSYQTATGIVHYHYPLTLAEQPNPGRKAERLPGIANDPFARDCVGQGGGGLLEKFIRIRRLREVAFELQEEVGRISAYDAKTIAIREMWNSFAQRKPQAKRVMEKAAEMMAAIVPAANARRSANAAAGRRAANVPLEFTDEELAQLNSIWGQFNRATANFPTANAERSRRAAEAAAAENAKLTAKAQANLPRPNVGPVYQPIKHTDITCCICLADENQPTWQFQHKKRDGSLYNHPLQDTGLCNSGIICQVDLANHIQNQIQEKGLLRFGRCWDQEHCDALLWPQEVQGKIPDDLYESYRVEFNKAVLYGRFPEIGQGGGRRMQHGGKVPFLTTISENSVEINMCQLPKKRGGATRKRRLNRKQRKTRHRRKN